MKRKEIIFIVILIIITVFIYYFGKKIKSNEPQTNKTENNIVENLENNSEKNLDTNIVKMEVSVENKNSLEGIVYTKPIEIKDEKRIEEIVNIINSAVLYPEEEFEETYGIGGYFESCPILNMYDEKGKKYTVVAMDNFDEELNIFYISEVEDLSVKILYKTKDNLESKINELYSETKEENNSTANRELDTFLEYMAFFNAKNDIDFQDVNENGIKLDIASYYADSYTYSDLSLLAYKKDDIELAMNEIFGEKLDIKTEGSLGLKYDNKTESFRYEDAGDSVSSTYLVKIEKQKYEDGIYTVTYVYAYPSEGDMLEDNLSEYDCFRTEVQFKENKNYTYSKYQLVNPKSIKSSKVGKIKNFQ